jgi:hypothetical protein
LLSSFGLVWFIRDHFTPRLCVNNAIKWKMMHWKFQCGPARRITCCQNVPCFNFTHSRYLLFALGRNSLTNGRQTLTHDKSSHGLWPGELKSIKKQNRFWSYEHRIRIMTAFITSKRKNHSNKLSERTMLQLHAFTLFTFCLGS